MQLRIIVGPNEIRTRGRELCRLKSFRNAKSFRGQPAGGWICSQVEGERCEEGMAYVVTLDLWDREGFVAALPEEHQPYADEFAAQTLPLASFSGLKGADRLSSRKPRAPVNSASPAAVTGELPDQHTAVKVVTRSDPPAVSESSP